MEPQVTIQGKVFLFRAKAPFEQSGRSVLGAIEYDAASRKIKCHECGEWFHGLGYHIIAKHGIDPKEYRDKHGLRRSTSLAAPGVYSWRTHPGSLSPEARADGVKAAADLRRRQAQSARPLPMERRNQNGTCRAQILDRLSRLSVDLGGRTPSRTEMAAAGLHVNSVLRAFNLPRIGDVMGLIGLPKNNPGKNDKYHAGVAAARKTNTKYSKALLTELLRDFFVSERRLPSGADFGNLLPSRSNFIHHFGSTDKAYQAAGLLEEAKRRRSESSRKIMSARTRREDGRII